MAARPTCAAPATRPLTSSSTTAGAWPARSGGSRSACSAAGIPVRRSRRLTRSGSRSSRPTSRPMFARTPAMGGETRPLKTWSGTAAPPTPNRRARRRPWRARARRAILGAGRPCCGELGGRGTTVTARGVVVIGGGLAGITAAIALREAGVGVTLLEARPWLGGATCSFSRGGLKIDNGQHVFLRCCTSYRELLARLGMTGSATLQDRFDVTVLSPGGGRARLRRSALPAPLHLSRALASYGFLSVPERLRVARAALALRTLDPARPWLDGQRLGDWLPPPPPHPRPPPRPWDPFIASSLNIDGD